MKELTEDDLKVFSSMGTASLGAYLAEDADSKTAVLPEEEAPEIRKRNLDNLMLAEHYYSSLSEFRKRRQRAVNFYRGDQWLDKVEVYENGRKLVMTEYEYLSRQGRPPIKQNMIRPAIKNLLGQYRSNPSKPLVFARNRDGQEESEMMSVALDATLDMNNFRQRDAHSLEEFLLSGCCIDRVNYGMNFERQRAIPQFEAVNPNRFFLNTDTEDILGNDVDFIGCIIDLPIEDVISTYAKNTADETRIRDIYRQVCKSKVRSTFNQFSNTAEQNIKNIDFYYGSNPDMCRVIEIWKKESEWRLHVHDYVDGSLSIRKKTKENIEAIEKENEKRKKWAKDKGMKVPLIKTKSIYTQYWKCYHLTPTGDTIFEGETPYKHGSHPFVYTFYPLIDGRAWGMVEDLIDQQKMINRYMILFDFINGASAKGVLIVPEESIPDDYSLEDIADEWKKFNGVIKIKTKAGAQIPHQIISSSVHPGLNEMIQMMLKFMQDIGGVQDASYGRNTGSSAAASLYAQQAQNSSLNNLDYVATFSDFIKRRDLRLIQLIQQYFTEKQFIRSSGNNYSHEAQYYDPEKIRNIDFDNAIGSSSDTPAFRALMDNTLMQLLQQQAIDIETYLENSTVPYAGKILESVRKRKAQMQEEQQQAMMMQQQMQQGQNLEQNPSDVEQQQV